ncbi:hypothetical protein KAR91_56450, partial [Candidatus Pacearchaeota archaeon]|nr:hypothetical protein [Candidatus Pacearchaeota archaeon]
KEEICSFREIMSIPEGHHILSIFPGSRKDTIKLLLPTMIKVILQLKNKFHNFHCCVSIADINFADIVNETISSLVSKSERSSFSTTMESSNVLLAASSYALLPSGTITLEAACLGVPGSIIYNFNKLTKLFGTLFTERNQLGNNNRCLTPFGLPNAILANMDFPPEDRPYREFILEEEKLNPDNIASHIENENGNLLEQKYSLSNPPKLDDSIVKTVRDAISPPGNKSPQGIIAGIITDSLLK